MTHSPLTVASSAASHSASQICLSSTLWIPALLSCFQKPLKASSKRLKPFFRLGLASSEIVLRLKKFLRLLTSLVCPFQCWFQKTGQVWIPVHQSSSPMSRSKLRSQTLNLKSTICSNVLATGLSSAPYQPQTVQPQRSRVCSLILGLLI